MKLFSLASAFCLLAVGNGMRHRAQDTLQTSTKSEMEMVNAETKAFVQLSVQDHYAAVDKQMDDMTTSEAIVELKKRGVPDELIEMMQELIAEKKPLPPSNISNAFKKVIDKINEMIAYVQMEYDVAELTCRGALEDLRAEIAAEASNMDLIQAQTGETQSFLLDWNNRKDEATKNIARVEEELSSHRTWCAAEIAATEESIRIYTDDYAQARFVYDKTMSKCVEKKKADPNSVASGSTRPPEPSTTVSLADFSAQLDAEIAAHTDSNGEVLLRCVNWMGRSFITFQHPKVAKAVLTMSRRFRNKFHSRLTLMAQEPATTTEATTTTTAAPVANGDKTEFNKQGSGKDDHANTSTEIKDLEKNGKTQEYKSAQAGSSNEEKKAESPLTITTTSASDPVGLIIPDALKNSGCTDSIGNMTSDKFKEMCVKVKEAIGELIDEVNNELHKQQAYLAETKQNCTHIEADLSEELKNYNEIKATAMSRIAMLTGRLTALQTDSRTAFNNYQKRSDEFKDKLAECKTSFAQAITGACAAKKIKKEISAISVAPVNPIIECQVTGWNEEEAQCSTPCGDKGVKQLSRKISVEPTPVWGAPCPALTAERTCNRKTCPIDCVVGSWNPFTPCSAKCNTGTMFRFKEVITEPRYNGEACGDIENLEFCNHEACDQDCALYPWTEFTPCDRACGTGMKYRRRNIQVEKKGQGYCPPILDDRRFELVKCNTQQCPEAKPVCNSKIDIVLAMDTSGSIGQEGFAASKQFALDFVNQMRLGPDAVSIGMIAFSDKPYIVTPLNYTKEVILKDVEEGFLWDAGMTATASALGMALQLLDNGARPGAMPIVVVVTDGMPTGIDPEWTEWFDTPGIAANVRARARLMFLSVGSYVEEEEIMSWATDGGDHNNYAHIHDYPVLIKALDELVVSLCPEIGTVDNSPVSTPEEAPKTVLFGRSNLRASGSSKQALVQSQNRATWSPKGVMWGEQRRAVLADRSQGTDPFEGFDTSLPY